MHPTQLIQQNKTKQNMLKNSNAPMVSNAPMLLCSSPMVSQNGGQNWTKHMSSISVAHFVAQLVLHDGAYAVQRPQTSLSVWQHLVFNLLFSDRCTSNNSKWVQQQMCKYLFLFVKVSFRWIDSMYFDACALLGGATCRLVSACLGGETELKESHLWFSPILSLSNNPIIKGETNRAQNQATPCFSNSLSGIILSNEKKG